jgi:hypothetical protein
VVESVEFSTSIFRTTNGKEQRFAERITPRRKLQFAVLLSRSEYQIFSAMLHDMGENGSLKTVRIADFSREGQGIVGDHASGATFVFVPSLPHWAVAGQTIAISTPTMTVFTTIQSVNVPLKRFTLPSGLSSALPSGSVVRPSVTGMLSFSTDLSYLTDEISMLNLKFRQTVGEQIAAFTATALPTFDGRSVLTTAPNWQGGIASSLIVDADSNDYSRGPIVDFLKNDQVTRTLNLNYLGRSFEDIGQITKLFSAMRGRQGEFWCPSWSNEMTSVDGITSGQSTIKVKGRIFADVYADSTVNKAVAIRLSDDSWVFRKITAITVNGSNPGQFAADYSSAFSIGESVVTVDQPFTQTAYIDEDFSQLFASQPIDVTVSRLEIVAIYWLYLGRMANDTLTLSWATDNLGETALSVTRLEYNPVE